MYVRIEFTSIHIYNVRSYMNTQWAKNVKKVQQIRMTSKVFGNIFLLPTAQVHALWIRSIRKKNHEMLILVFQANNAAPLNSIFFVFIPLCMNTKKLFFFYAYVGTRYLANLTSTWRIWCRTSLLIGVPTNTYFVCLFF